MPPTELLERQDQLATLHTHLSAATAGTGRLVFVGGEAGIGKSVLVRRFGDAVARDFRVLVGACDAMGTPRDDGLDMRHVTRYAIM